MKVKESRENYKTDSMIRLDLLKKGYYRLREKAQKNIDGCQ